MYKQAVGFSHSSLLSGLSPKASAFSKGRAMQNAAGLDMDREKQNQDFAVQQMQDTTQANQKAAANSAQRATNESQERMRGRDLDTQRRTFNIGMNYDYAALQRQNQLRLQQSLLNGLARDF